MSHYVINGGRRLEGSVTISGAKNAAVAIIPAVILAGEMRLVENLPQIEDVRILEQILQHMGADVEFTPDGAMRIDPKKINTHTVTFDMVSRLRASYYLLGAMLGPLWPCGNRAAGGAVPSAKGPLTSTLKACVRSARRWSLSAAS